MEGLAALGKAAGLVEIAFYAHVDTTGVTRLERGCIDTRARRPRHSFMPGASAFPQWEAYRSMRRERTAVSPVLTASELVSSFRGWVATSMDAGRTVKGSDGME